MYRYYDYACTCCDRLFEQMVTIDGRDSVGCPRCGVTAARIPCAPAFKFVTEQEMEDRAAGRIPLEAGIEKDWESNRKSIEARQEKDLEDTITNVVMEA